MTPCHTALISAFTFHSRGLNPRNLAIDRARSFVRPKPPRPRPRPINNTAGIAWMLTTRRHHPLLASFTVAPAIRVSSPAVEARSSPILAPSSSLRPRRPHQQHQLAVAKPQPSSTSPETTRSTYFIDDRTPPPPNLAADDLPASPRRSKVAQRDHHVALSLLVPPTQLAVARSAGEVTAVAPPASGLRGLATSLPGQRHLGAKAYVAATWLPHQHAQPAPATTCTVAYTASTMVR